MTESNNPLGLQTFIRSIKQELLSNDPQDPNPLFAIDEITVEVKFAVEGAVEGGVSQWKVVEIGSDIEEQHVHTATIRLVSLLDREQLLDEIIINYPEFVKTVESLRNWLGKGL